MDFVLVLPLILSLISNGHSSAENAQCVTCKKGFYKVGACQDNTCKPCETGFFTEIENFKSRCNRCTVCTGLETEMKPCTNESDRVCDCKAGYYYVNFTTIKYCRQCPCETCPRHGCGEDCEKKCLTTTTTTTTITTTPISTLYSTSTSSTTAASGDTPAPTSAPTSRTPALNNTQNPAVHPIPNQDSDIERLWLFLVVALVTVLVLLCLLHLFIRGMTTYMDYCPCWCSNKDLELPAEDPRFNEQHSHPGGDPTTLVFTSEETPIVLSHSPAVPEHPAHDSPLLPGSDHVEARHDEQPDQWPAIVLYAIIKEVPLRRWKEFLRLLSVADQQLERVELEAGLGSMERQYQMLRLWSQRSSASLNDVFSALHYMHLSGCAQLLQENLEQLQGRPEPKQGVKACRSQTNCGVNGAVQET